MNGMIMMFCVITICITFSTINSSQYSTFVSTFILSTTNIETICFAMLQISFQKVFFSREENRDVQKLDAGSLSQYIRQHFLELQSKKVQMTKM